MSSQIWQLLVPPGILAFALPAFGMALLWMRWQRFQDRRLGRRHPLNQGLLRPPGHRLADQMQDLLIEFFGYLLAGPFLAAASLLGVFASAYLTGQTPSASALILALLIAALVATVSSWRAVRTLQRFKRLRLGWEGELATAEELNKLMKDGYEIFHDVPADGFNVDHVIVGPSGVYAVETKARTKQSRSGPTRHWEAIYDGKTLDLGGYKSTGFLKQAQRQAEWLSRWLSSATGENVAVTPVLALPGWLVTRKGRGDIRVISPKEARSLVRSGKSQPLSDEKIRRIGYQLEQRCREVSADKIKGARS